MIKKSIKLINLLILLLIQYMSNSLNYIYLSVCLFVCLSVFVIIFFFFFFPFEKKNIIKKSQYIILI